MKEQQLTKWLEYSKRQKTIEKQLEAALKKQSGVSLSEYYAIYELSIHGKKMKISELGDYLCLSTSAFSRVIKRLEEKESPLVTRISCTEDKRSTYVSLTEAGKNELLILQEVIDKGLEKYFLE